MRTTWPAFTMIALLLGGPLSGVLADGLLDTRIDFGDSLRNRLIVEVPKIWFAGESRFIVWTEWDDWPANAPLYRVATQMPGFALGPLSLTGGLRELRSPHSASARGSAWRETTGARLDAGIDPGARRGLSLSLPIVPVRGSVIHTGDGLAAAASIGSWVTDGAEPGRSWIELTAAASRPAALLGGAFEDGGANSDPVEIGWFDRVPVPVDMLHLLSRGRFRILPGSSLLEVGPAIGVSLAHTLPPGWWCRLAVSAELSLAPAWGRLRRGLPGNHELDLEAVVISSISSARYRLPWAGIPAEGAAVAFAVRADLNGHDGVATAGVNAMGRFATAWRGEAAVPGVRFTLMGLESKDAELGAGTYVTVGGWRLSLGTTLDAGWHDVPEGDVGAIVGPPARAAGVATELLVAVEYESPGEASPGTRLASLYHMLSPGGGATFKLARDDSQRLELQFTGVGELQLGPVVFGSDRLINLSGKISLNNDDGGWGPGGATAEGRMKFHVGSAEYRAGVEVRWDRDSEDPVAWDAELGWTVRGATGGE